MSKELRFAGKRKRLLPLIMLTSAGAACLLDCLAIAYDNRVFRGLALLSAIASAVVVVLDGSFFSDIRKKRAQEKDEQADR